MDNPEPRPLLIFDGECDFCRRWIASWRWKTGDLIEYAPYQDASTRCPNIPSESLQQAVHLVEPDGHVSRAAEAVFRTLAHVPGKGLGFWLYRFLPGFAPITEWGYRLTANHRQTFSRLTSLLWGRDPRPSTYLLARDVFLRLLGVVYLIAILSLWTQIHGLIGSNGILPLGEYLDLVRDRLGPQCYWQLPTLCWLDSSDGFLHGLCAAGTLLAMLLILGIAPIPVLLALWVVYLSLSVAGQEFLSFQWDTLLLEAGFMALFLAPARLWMRPRQGSPPSTAGLALLRLLLFKLVFLSGITKLLSGDPTWRDGTAMNYHYETQPIPTWTSWYMHQMPEWFQRVSVSGMLMIEVLVPFLIVAPRRVRHLAAVLLASFQMLIAATGNYGFFNLLAIVLCVSLLDDQLLLRLAPKRRRAWLDQTMCRRPRGGWTHRARSLAVVLLIFASTLTLIKEMVRTQRPNELPGWSVWVLDRADALLLSWGQPAILHWIGPFRTINGYGLFRVMTTERPEIVVQGSSDGTTWQDYEFRWKVGNPMRRPRFVAPHQPRLDWQMWFAALNPRGNVRWLQGLALGLLESDPEVLALLKHNPFPHEPPRWVRFVYYRYHFTDADERRATGAWWKREELGRARPMSLQGGARRPDNLSL